MTPTPEQLERLIESGVVNCIRHPNLPLSLFNYTPECQYARRWCDVSLQCRGLVMERDKIVARPFRKFFNDTEHAADEIPWHLPCEATEKLDGSLLIWFCHEGFWMTATRGSFTSEQSRVGYKIIRDSYSLDYFDPAVTYLFEVLYPENRVVLDYGARREVVLLGMIHTATGEELPLGMAPAIKSVRRLPPDAPLSDLRSIIRDDEEGYVLRFSNGFRCKVKGAKYIELHKVLSGVSSRMVWEYLSQSKPIADILAIVPDEYADWIREQEAKLQAKVQPILNEVLHAHQIALQLATRKEQARFILGSHGYVKSAVFALLDGKDATGIIWRMIYPEFERPRAALRELI